MTGRVTNSSTPILILPDLKEPPEWRSYKGKPSLVQEAVQAVYRHTLTFKIIMVLLTLLAVAVLAVGYSLDEIKLDPEDENENSVLYPQLASNFPDPSILYHDGMWYAYATNIAAGVINEGPPVHHGKHYVRPARANIQGAYSRDFFTWNYVPISKQPLRSNGRWAMPPSFDSDNTWAPSVIRRDDGKFVLYFAATVNSSTENPNPNHNAPHCIGVALSEADHPMGPYVASDKALICPLSTGGAIDAQPFRDHDGTLHLLYKIDGNNLGHGGDCGNTVPPLQDTPIMIQKLLPDGMTLSPSSTPIEILNRTPEDGPLVEAPMLVQPFAPFAPTTNTPSSSPSPSIEEEEEEEEKEENGGGPYILFYSSGCTQTPTYTIRYAISSSLQGPYIRATKPLLETGTSLGGHYFESPGSVGVARDPVSGKWMMAFHARMAPRYKEWGHVRAMYAGEVEFVRTEEEGDGGGGPGGGGVEVRIVSIGHGTVMD
jgi:hypothetical protein